MFAKISFVLDNNNKYSQYNLELVRIRGIFNETNTTELTGPDKFNFTQQAFGKKSIQLQYAYLPSVTIIENSNTIFNTAYNYGSWSNDESILITDTNL